MRFAYCKYRVDPDVRSEEFTHRPLVPVQLTGSSGTHEFWGLLDTGADESYITQEMADFLGVVPIPGILGTVQSASGEMTVEYTRIKLRIEQEAESYEWETVVGIAQEPWPEAILGHSGALEFFDVTFLGDAKEIVLNRNRRPLVEDASTR